MTEKLKLEVGSIPMDQASREFGVSTLLEYSLRVLGENIVAASKERRDDPFENTGSRFKNDVFEVEAYSWDDEYEQPFNFRWRDLRVSWYKYIGRGMSANRPVDAQTVHEMLIECLGSIWGTSPSPAVPPSEG